MFLFTLFDRVAEDFGPLFEARTEGAAVRKVRALAEREGFRQEDYVLFRVGTVARAAGTLEVVGVNRPVEVAWRSEE